MIIVKENAKKGEAETDEKRYQIENKNYSPSRLSYMYVCIRKTLPRKETVGAFETPARDQR